MLHHSVLSELRLNKIICVEEVKQIGNNNVVLPQGGFHLKRLFQQIVINRKAPAKL